MSTLFSILSAIQAGVSVVILSSLSSNSMSIWNLFAHIFFYWSTCVSVKRIATRRIGDYVEDICKDGIVGITIGWMAKIFCTSLFIFPSYLNLFCIMFILSCIRYRIICDEKNSSKSKSLVLLMNSISVMKDTAAAMIFIGEEMYGFSFESVAYYSIIKFILAVVGYFLDMDTYIEGVSIMVDVLKNVCELNVWQKPISPSNYIGYTQWTVLWTVEESLKRRVNGSKNNKKGKIIYVFHYYNQKVAHPP